MYGLLGGAAVLVGAALISHYLSQKEPDPFDDDINCLGALQRDATGHIEFEQFIKIFEISANHAKIEFAEKKKAFIAERR
jgi:hypothetical protein